MLLDSFEEQLEVVRGFAQYKMGIIEPVHVGETMMQSFSVEIRHMLHGELIGQGIRIASAEVELPHLGKLIRKKDIVIFEPCDELRADVILRTLRLGPFLRKWIKSDTSNFLGTFTWHTVFQASKLEMYEQVFPCMQMLSKLGADIILYLIKKDHFLEHVPFKKCEEAFCLYIHDAITSGHGIEIEPMGVIKQDLCFEVDPQFQKDLEILHREHIIDPSQKFKISTLRVGPLPKFSKTGRGKKKQ